MTSRGTFREAYGLETISGPDEPSTVLDRIETIAFKFLNDFVATDACGSIVLINRTSRNTHEDDQNGALLLGCMVQYRRLSQRSSKAMARLLEVMSVIQRLVLSGERISQRELFYLLMDLFDNQNQLNNIVLDVSAALGVPRYALNIGAATRGVLAGSLRLALSGSPYFVDCEHVGTNGWPIPGDIISAISVVLTSTARYILRESIIKNCEKGTICMFETFSNCIWLRREVIEKFGIFSRLVQDRFFDQIPCILVCGKGYPSIATRALTSVLAERLRIPVLGVADFNPHGLALLQSYAQGSVRSSIEGSHFVCDVKWLALRSSHIRENARILANGEPLTGRDETVLAGLKQRNSRVREDKRYVQETEAMKDLGKYELQWLYGHHEGISFFQRFLLKLILHADYF